MELKDLLTISLLLLLNLFLFFGILFGERSIGYYQQLRADDRKINRMVEELKEQSTALQNQLMELRVLEDKNFTIKRSF
jgi:cell division protein FtsB